MSSLDRRIAGLTRRDVLTDLSHFVDRELPPARVEQIRAHISACHECEQFGGVIAELVHALRGMRESPPLAEDVAARLRDRLRAQTGEGGGAGRARFARPVCQRDAASCVRPIRMPPVLRDRRCVRCRAGCRARDTRRYAS